MTIAVWDYPAADLLARGLSAQHEVVTDAPRGCAARLQNGTVDLALLPTLDVMRATDRYDPCAGVALSSWRYPYARLVLKEALDTSLASVAFDPIYTQEVLLTRIVLQEHYGFSPTFVPYEDPSVDELLGAEEEASLVVGRHVPFLQPNTYAMDVGQEWYELTQYPMVWGLFAGRTGEPTAEMVASLVEGARQAQHERPAWIQAQETTPSLHQFYSEDLRIHLDDLAVAGLTALQDQLFYHKVLEDVPTLTFVEAPEEDEGPPQDDNKFHL